MADRTRELLDFPGLNPAPVMALDNRGVLWFANDAANVLHGEFHHGVGEPLPDTAFRGVQAAAAGDGQFEVQAKGHWWSLQCVGHTDGYNLYGHDISHLRRAESALQDTLRRQESILRHLDLGVLVEDNERRVVALNQQLLDMFGIRESQRALVGTDARELLAAVERMCPVDHRTDNLSLVRDKEVSLGSRLVLGDGRTLQRDYVPVLDAAQLQGHFWRFRDVSLSEAQAQEMATLSLVASKTGTAVVITDAKGHTQWVNDAFISLTGYTLNDMAGRKPGHVLQGPATNAKTVSEIRSGIAGGRSFRTEILNYRKDGAPYWVEMHINPVHDEDGQITRFIAVETDVSDRHRLAAELVSAKESAEDASAAKSRFLAVMSHEVRTPLNVITGLADLALDLDLPDDLREFVVGIAANGEHLRRVISDVLDLSRIEAGTLDLEPRTFRPSDSLNQLHAQFRGQFAARGLQLHCLCLPDVPAKVIADEDRIMQVLTNLVGNALKHTERGGVTVLADTCHERESGQLDFTVVDTGEGMSAEVMARAFERFERGDSGTTRAHDGAGLGLSIGRSLAELLGGDLSLQSEPGRGVEASLRVPVATVGSEVVGDGVSLPEGMAVGVSVALPALKRAVESWLRRWGCEVLGPDGGATPQRPLAWLVDDAGRSAIGAEPLEPVLVLGREPRPQSGSERGVRCSPDAIATALRGLSDRQTVWMHTPKRRVAPVLSTAQRTGKILLMEDNPDGQALFSRVLRHGGHELVVVSNGVEGVERLRRESFDLVLCDLEMPQLDGFGAAREIRAYEAETGRRRAPIIALTAHAIAGVKERCLGVGMDDYATKPIKRAALLELVDKWLAEVAPVAAPDVTGLFPLAEIEEVYIDADIADLVPSFLGSRRQDAAQLAAAARAQDWQRAHRIAHNLKGVGGAYGFERVSELGVALLNAVGSRDAQACEGLCERLESYLDRVVIHERAVDD